MGGLMAVGIIVSIIILCVCLGYWLCLRSRTYTATVRIDPPKPRAPEIERVRYSPVPVFKSENLPNAFARGWYTPAAGGIAERLVGLPPFEPACRGTVPIIAVKADSLIKLPPTIQEGDIVYCVPHSYSYTPIDDELVLIAVPAGRFVIRPYQGKKGQEQVLATVLGIARWDV